MAQRRTQLLRQVFNLYKNFGSANYIGESVSQLQHAAQTAALAEKDAYPKPVILAAFLHDIGHLVRLNDNSNQMGEYGVKSHEDIGSSFLRLYRFPFLTCDLIRGHVSAKRFQVTINKNYYDSLSDASKKSLQYQGGEMSKDELVAFIKDPLYEYNIKMREWDDQAKETAPVILNKIDEVKVIEKYYNMACKIVPH